VIGTADDDGLSGVCFRRVTAGAVQA
jgi:hypothetical protein